MSQWATILGEAGSNVAMYRWFPIFGGGAADFDFKRVSTYQNYTELGADYERIGNGGLFRQSGALMGHLLECDTDRVYNVQNRRFVDVRPGQRRD